MVNKKTDDMNETNKTTKKTVRRKTTKKKDASAKPALTEKRTSGTGPAAHTATPANGAEEGQPDLYGNHEPHGRRRLDAGPNRQDVRTLCR